MAIVLSLASFELAIFAVVDATSIVNFFYCSLTLGEFSIVFLSHFWDVFHYNF